MRDKDQGASGLLALYEHLLHPALGHALYLRLLPFVHQTAQ